MDFSYQGIIVERNRPKSQTDPTPGPDSSGKWISPGGRVALGQVRLAINDLSRLGSQPISDPEEKVYAVVNGELYEYERLRASMIEKQGYRFKSRSDSELVIALYKYYGAPSFLSHLRGEFSFCLYDSTRQIFIAARDRYGIKPLFWTMADGRLLVASEMKAFLPIEAVKFEWDVRSILNGGHGLAASTHFTGIEKVRPGHYLICQSFRAISQVEYWDSDYPDKNMKDPRSTQEMIRGVRDHLLEAIRIRLRADVKVGVSLSGGLDSSAVAGIVNHLTKRGGEKIGSGAENERLTCFGIGFDVAKFDESDIATRTAQHLGVKFHKVHMNEKRLADGFEEATWHVEHPQPNLNFVGTFALSELVREKGFRVILNGQGSDEIFAGYPFFPVEYLREPDTTSDHPGFSEQTRKQELVELDYRGPPAANAKARTQPLSAGRRQINNVSVITTVSPSLQPAVPHKPWVERCYGASDLHETINAEITGTTMAKIQTQWHPLHTAEYLFTKAFLPNFLLNHLGDGGEMAHSIEGRTPFLDHHLTAYVNGLPPSVKLKRIPRAPPSKAPKMQLGPATRFTEKWILREVARPFISDEVYYRKKWPYWAPVTFPSNGPLHRLLKGLVTEANLEQYVGFVDAKAVVGIVDQAFGADGGVKLGTVVLAAMYVVLGRRFRVQAARPVEGQP